MNRLNLIKMILSNQSSANILKIAGSGALSSTIVQNAIDNYKGDLTAITTIEIDKGFTSASSGCLDVIDSNTDIPSNLILMFYTGYNANIYTNFKAANTKINKLYYMGTSLAMNTTAWRANNYLELFYAPNATSIGYHQGGSNSLRTYLPKATGLAYFYAKGKAYTPKYKSGELSRTWFEDSSKPKLFISNAEANPPSPGQAYRHTHSNPMVYFSANDVASYLNGTNLVWTNQYVRNNLVGVLDGAHVYQALNGYKDMNMNYPILSDTLTINSANGHLIENEIDLFNGYTVVWYDDEDCTNAINPVNITPEMTVYCRLSN